MQNQLKALPTPPKRGPWNRGKLTAAKATAATQTRLASIRTKLQIEGRARDLAMFNLAIDSKLRGCRHPRRGCRRQRVHGGSRGGPAEKTGRPVRFELSEQTRQAIDDYLKAANKRPGEFLFTGRRGPRPA